MARQIFNTRPAATQSPLALGAAPRAATLSSAADIKARLRQKRSAAYLQALKALDAGGHVHNRQAGETLLATIRQELPDISVESLPAGVVAKCFLGEPYEVHTLDCSGLIAHHFKRGEAMPAMLERARQLAASGQYACIEVYPRMLICVGHGGQTAVIEG